LQIDEIQLVTRQLSQQKAFYAQGLELPLVADSATSFTVQAGATRVTFAESPEPMPSVYHFAFNIPENKLAEAKQWLAPRASLRKNGERDEWHFVDWNAHAVYFGDPAGNVVEFIARHNLPNAVHEPFDGRAILSVSEIGLATPDVRESCEQLRSQLGITRWRGNDTDFAAMGGEEGLFIVVANGRRWFADGTPARPLPTTVVIGGEQNTRLVFNG
jgi:catechol-2,3-dioxygenase